MNVSRLAAAAATLAIGLGFLPGTALPASALAASGTAVSGTGTGVPAGCPWMNTRLSPGQRATLLLNASTLDQKLRWLDEQAANTPAQTTFSGVTYPAQVACTPTVVYTDGPDYVRPTTGATIFPAQLALAASWSTRLAYAKGQAEAAEAFRAGKNAILGPGVFSSRTPLDGRTPEFLGRTRCSAATWPRPTSTACRPATQLCRSWRCSSTTRPTSRNSTGRPAPPT